MYPTTIICGMHVPTFSLVLLFAIFFCVWIYCFKFGIKDLLDSQTILSIAFIGALFGGKLLSVIICFINGWNVSNAIFGNVFFGSIIGGMITTWCYCMMTNKSYYLYSDKVFTIVPIGQAIGRVGCYCNGCCYGRKTNSIFSVLYHVDGTVYRVYPTWFIEALGCLVLFCLLQRIKNNYGKGLQTCLYLIGYSVLRFNIEFFRGDDVRGIYGCITTSQIISFVLIIIGIIGLIVYDRKNRSNECEII